MKKNYKKYARTKTIIITKKKKFPRIPQHDFFVVISLLQHKKIMHIRQGTSLYYFLLCMMMPVLWRVQR